MLCRSLSVPLIVAVLFLANPAPLLAVPKVPSSGATAPSKPSPEELLKEARRIERRASKLRGLRIRRSISKGVLDRGQLEQRIQAKLNKHYTDQEIKVEGDVLKRLGLLPQELDYRKTVVDLLTSQVAGFYDPFQRKLFLASWIPAALQEPALAHEICHALQDQHFSLKRFVKPRKNNTDAQLAQLALVEGDCTALMLEYVLFPYKRDLSTLSGVLEEMIRKTMSGVGNDTLSSAPRYLRESLLFPYLRGLRFIQQIRRRHPWKLVNKVFSRPPKSTEQVLHYDKYWDRERPVRIRSRSLPCLAPMKLLREDVLGEFHYSLYLSTGVATEIAQRAAAGWGGDRLAAYGNQQGSGLPLLVNLSTWDSEADAIEFANAQRHVLLDRKLKQVFADAGHRLDVYQGQGGEQWSVQHHRRHVLVLMGVPATIRPKLQQEVWERWRVGSRRVRPPKIEETPTTQK